MIESAREYHDLTGYRRHDLAGHSLNWSHQPSVFKNCPGTVDIPLPRNVEWQEKRLSDLLLEPPAGDVGAPLDIERLSRVLFLTHALTAKARHGGVDFYYRSVASAGALYPFEMYVAVFGAQGLDPGFYHHKVFEQSLTLIRPGGFVGELTRLLCPEADPPPALLFLLTSIFYRSSWKYRDRAYRYHLLDTGHLAENLSPALKSERLPYRFFYDFDDHAVNSLMGVDAGREACLVAVAAWTARKEPTGGDDELGDAVEGLAEASQVSPGEVEYPSILEIHAASSRIVEPTDVISSMSASLGLDLYDERPISHPERRPESLGYADAVFKRRSMRNFVPDVMPADCFAGLLTLLCSDGGPDSEAVFPGNDAVAVGCLTGNVEGSEPGFYLLDREKKTISSVFRRAVMRDMMRVCLDQAWLANCAAHFLFLTNLNLLEKNRGPRGYRHAMLAAGRLGQRLYLAATAMRLGCCGIGAFYDDEAARLLGLNDGSRLLYLVAVGPVRKLSTR